MMNNSAFFIGGNTPSPEDIAKVLADIITIIMKQSKGEK